MDDDLFKFRMQIRQMKITNELDYYDDIEDDEIDKNLSEEQYNKKFYQHLFSLLEEKSQEEIFYFVKFFHLDSQDPLLEAIKSMPNFEEFLKALLLSNYETVSYYALMTIMLITYCDNIDFNTFTDPQVLAFLFMKVNDDFYYFRLMSLKVITNLVIQYKEVYEFFSQNNFAEQLKDATNFKSKEYDSEYKQTDDRSAKIFEAVSYLSKVIARENLIRPEEAPILWNTASFVINIDGGGEATANAVAVFGYLAHNGYIFDFDEGTMEYFKVIPADNIDTLQGFRFLINNLPSAEAFFANLIERGIMEFIMDSINVLHCKEENSEVVYMILGDLKFVSEDEEFWALTFQRLRGPFRIYTRKAIVYYLTRITYSTSTNLMKQMVNHDIFIDIDDLLSTGDKTIIEVCLNFIEVLLHCYAEAFQKQPSTFQNAPIIENKLNELLMTLNDETDEQIDRILELFK